MFTIDDRTGNILTTIAAFAAIVAVVVAIAATYSILPAAADQFRRFNTAVPALAARVNAMSWTGRGDVMAGVAARATEAAASAAENAVWLLLVPVVAIFFLGNRTAFLDALVDLFGKRGDRAKARRTIHQVDEALAQYTRAQLILAALSVAFYIVSMAVLRIPYAVALGIIGGALEFVPVLGRVMGDRLQMEPLTVLLALMIGSEVGGLPGAILSIPLVAVLRIVSRDRTSRDVSPVALVKP